MDEMDVVMLNMALGNAGPRGWVTVPAEPLRRVLTALRLRESEDETKSRFIKAVSDAEDAVYADAYAEGLAARNV